MEAAVVNTLSRGDRALVVRGGKFGERWGDLCEAYGIDAIYIDIEWGRAADPAEIKKALDENPDIRAVFTTLCETSTCVRNDIEAIGKIVAASQAIFVVDAVSGLCAEDLKTDEWGVDIAVTGSQKALMLPPGLAFASVSPKAEERIKGSDLPKFYLSLAKALKSLEKDDTPFTSAVSLIYGLKESLALLKEEGLENVIERHARLAHATREAARALGLELLAKAPSNVATAMIMPDGIDAEKLRKILSADMNITVAGGQDALKGSVIRVAHLGYCSESDTITTVSAIEMALKKLGHDCEPGAGVAAVEKALSQ
jgi:aspartate aminotransferase-like enzyme